MTSPVPNSLAVVCLYGESHLFLLKRLSHLGVDHELLHLSPSYNTRLPHEDRRAAGF